MDSSDLANLMQHVRFQLIPNDLLVNDILTCDLISQNTDVMKMVREALQFQSAENLYSQPLKEGKQFQPRGEQNLVLVRVREAPNTIPETRIHMLSVHGDERFETQLSEKVLPIAINRLSISVVTKGNYLFLFGTDREYIRPIAVRFDVKTNTWLDLKPVRHQEVVGKAIALLESNIYLFGGVRSCTNVQNITSRVFSAFASQYSIENNSWSRLEDLPNQLAFHAAASHGNYVFSAGGCTRDANSTDKLYAFDVVGKIWLSKAAMNRKRVLLSLEAVGEKLVACGGKQSPSVEIYDIVDNQWTLIQNETLENHVSPATIVKDDKLYVIGGSTRDLYGTESNTDYVSCVDVGNGTVDTVSCLPFEVSNHACVLLTVPNTATG